MARCTPAIEGIPPGQPVGKVGEPIEAQRPSTGHWLPPITARRAAAADLGSCKRQISGSLKRRTFLPAGGQDHLVVIMTASLRAHRRNQVFVADNPAGLAADHLEVLHGPFHAVLGAQTDVVIRLMRQVGMRENTDGGEELDVRLRLVRNQRQHDHVAGLLLLPGDQVVDRLQVVLLVHRQQVHVQDK
jgi:hypothetical protein